MSMKKIVSILVLQISVFVSLQAADTYCLRDTFVREIETVFACSNCSDCVKAFSVSSLLKKHPLIAEDCMPKLVEGLASRYGDISGVFHAMWISATSERDEMNALCWKQQVSEFRKKED